MKRKEMKSSGKLEEVEQGGGEGGQQEGQRMKTTGGESIVSLQSEVLSDLKK